MCSTLLPDDGLLSHPGKTLKRVPVKLQREMGLDTCSISTSDSFTMGLSMSFSFALDYMRFLTSHFNFGPCPLMLSLQTLLRVTLGLIN